MALKILGIINKDSAVAYHRITLPLLLLPDTDVHITNNINEETFEQGFDVVFYSRLLNEFAFNKLIEMRAKHGFKIVVDVDDYWVLDHWHVLNEEYERININRVQVDNIRNADAVFVTHERLYSEAVNFNKNTFIIPNAIPKAAQFAETITEESDRIRLFWQGSVTHEADIKLIQYAIENLANTRRNVIKMVMAGFHPEEDVWVRMAKMFTSNKRIEHTLFRALHYEHYYKSYAHADICLVPLVNSRFNSMKSNLKVLEAGNMSLPVIAHNVNPYKELPVRYANGTTEWVTAMKYYIDNENARLDDGAMLNEFCDKYYNYESINQIRKDVFSDILILKNESVQ